MNRTELLQLFRSAATEIAERHLGNITEETMIADLGIDSLGILELIAMIERTTEYRIPDERLVNVQTVKDILDVTEACLKDPTLRLGASTRPHL